MEKNIFKKYTSKKGVIARCFDRKTEKIFVNFCKSEKCQNILVVWHDLIFLYKTLVYNKHLLILFTKIKIEFHKLFSVRNKAEKCF